MIGRGLCALAILASVLSPAYAGNRCNKVVQVQSFALQSGLVVTPFSLPVGVPVAAVQSNPVVYGFQSIHSGGGYAAASTGGYSAASVNSKDAMYDAIADKVVAKLRAAGAGGSFSAMALPEKPSLVTANCAKCHSGATAALGFRVDIPMSAEAKLKALGLMLHDDPTKRMPKGKALDPQTLGLTLQELAGKPNGGPGPTPAPPPPAVDPIPEAPVPEPAKP